MQLRSLYNRVQKSLAEEKRGAEEMKKYCFGIDIGGTTVKCGLFNVDGEVLDKWEIKTRTENNGENIIADIAETIECQDRRKRSGQRRDRRSRRWCTGTGR